MFPADNIWNTPVDGLPADANSAIYVNTIGAAVSIHPDFGSGLWDGGPIGIPFAAVSNQPGVPVVFDYADESDPGPYPIPPNAPIEGGPGATGDRHVLIVDQGNCVVFELYSAYPQPDGSWNAGSGAIFDLKSNRLRPSGWTSADAAGLPIFPGLVRYEEILAGEIKHAIRFTAPQTRHEYVWPARHFASSLTDTRYPPMGQRFRLRSSYDLSGFSAVNQVILRAMQKYGIILADNGSSWYISGAPDARWDNEDLHALSRVTGADFEAVDVSQLMADPDSAQVRGASSAPAITSVVNSASFQAGLAAGAWITVFGTNLAMTTRSWRGDEITGGKLPSELDGVRVTVNGSPAAISYISPTQINLQAPDLNGSAQLLVTTPQGSASAAVTIGQTAPALFLFQAESRRYAAAQHAADYSIAGKSGLYPGSVPARPGETIILYGTGFGPTSPAVAAGDVVTQAAPLSDPVTAYVGGVPAEVVWTGLSAAGLDQLNIRVPPSLPAGDAVVVVQLASGTASQDGVFLTVVPYSGHIIGI